MIKTLNKKHFLAAVVFLGLVLNIIGWEFDLYENLYFWFTQLILATIYSYLLFVVLQRTRKK